MSENVKKKLPEGWRWVKLGEVCEEKMGLRDPHKQPDTPFYYVDISSIDNNIKQIVDFKKILGKDAPSRARQIICKDDVIVATTRPNLNAVAIVPPHLDNQICSTGFCVLRAKSDLDTQYLFAFVQTKDFIESLSDLVKGALYPAVTDKQVREQMIPLPPLPTQQRLAARLNDQLATVGRAHLAAQAQLEEAKNLPAAYLRQVFPKMGEVLPEGWRWVKLGDIADFKNGINFTSNQKGTGILTVDVLNMYSENIYLNMNNLYRVDIGINNEYLLGQSDILFVRSSVKREGVGWATLFPGYSEPVTFCGFLIRARLKNLDVHSPFLVNYLRSSEVRDLLIAKAGTGTITNISQDKLQTIAIPLPPLPTQQRLATRLNDQLAAVGRLRLAAQAQLNEINALPAALLRKAFNGE